jgi:hypothetical protein
LGTGAKEISVSNIPNSAMPHAWANDEDEDGRRMSANQLGFSLAGLAIAGGLAAVLYLVFGRGRS